MQFSALHRPLQHSDRLWLVLELYLWLLSYRLKLSVLRILLRILGVILEGWRMGGLMEWVILGPRVLGGGSGVSLGDYG